MRQHGRCVHAREVVSAHTPHAGLSRGEQVAGQGHLQLWCPGAGGAALRHPVLAGGARALFPSLQAQLGVEELQLGV